MRHAVLGGGKRVRPLLAYAAGEFAQADPEVVDAAATAVELIHAYSLVHDDLPCMDDDTLRRGKPTCHVAFGEATALLAGDALQSLAFGVLGASPMRASGGACALLAAAAGAPGMAGGQAIDLASTGVALSLPELQTMHRMKTGALIRAAVQLGAACGRPLAPAGNVRAGHICRGCGTGIPGRRRRARCRGLRRCAGQDRGQGCRAEQADLRLVAGSRRGPAPRRGAACASRRSAGAVSQRGPAA